MVKLTVTPTRRRSTGANVDKINRESYLLASIDLIAPFFKESGNDIPPVRVSVGWPGSRRGIHDLGSCWKKEASADGTFQIFVSPIIDDTVRALDILIHELCHAVTNCEGHNDAFGLVARAVGLDGKLTATFAGDALRERLNVEVIAKLGKYPHSALNPTKSGKKTQTTRLIKMTCPESGYTARTTRQWLDKYGALISPVTGKPMVFEKPAADEKADEKGGDE